MSKKKLLVIIFVLVLLLASASVFGVLAWKSKERAEEMVPAPVSFSVNAEGWSEETSSPIPIRVTGKTLDDEKVDEKYFLGFSDKDFSLKPGSYEVEVYASPINGDGGMYKCSKAVKVSVPKNTDKSKKSKGTAKPQSQPSASTSASASDSSAALVTATLDLSPIPANEITDEDIAKAEAAMKDAGLDEAKIKSFTDSARNARQAELDRIKANEEAERIAKEREAMGMYSGAGGPRPANAQPWPVKHEEYTSNSMDYYAQIELAQSVGCWLEQYDGLYPYCIPDVSVTNLPVVEHTTEGGPYFAPANVIGVRDGAVIYHGWCCVHPLNSFYLPELPVGGAWYSGNYVLGRTAKGITVWDMSSGHGFFMSNDGKRIETF